MPHYKIDEHMALPNVLLNTHITYEAIVHCTMHMCEPQNCSRMANAIFAAVAFVLFQQFSINWII